MALRAAALRLNRVVGEAPNPPLGMTSSFLALALRAVGVGWRKATGLLRVDHRPINERTHRHLDATMTRFFAYVAAAPSRSPPRRDVEHWTQAAITLRDQLPIVGLPTQPDWLTDVEARWNCPPAADGARAASLRITRSGLLEVFVALDEGDEPQDSVLDVEEIANVIAMVETAVESRAFHKTAGWRMVGRLRKVDVVAAVTARRSSDDGARAWSALRFPAAGPPRSAQRIAMMPPLGYGRPELWSMRRRGLEGRATAVVIGQLLRANGYFELGGLPDRLSVAARARRTPA